MPRDQSVHPCPPHVFAVLVVEDDPTFRMLLEEILAETWPCRVFSAATGQKALQIASHVHLDLLLLDYHVQGALTGLEVYDQICLYRRLPAILLSASPPDVGSRPLSVLSKPLEVADLLVHIQSVMQANGVTLPSDLAPL